jgi:uncharacterized protein with ParB-like and HNH nuclease domain
MEKLLSYTYILFEYVERTRIYVSDILEQNAIQYPALKSAVSYKVQEIESRLKHFSPITIILGTLVIFYLFSKFLSLLYRTYNRISKIVILLKLFLDSIEKIKIMFIRFYLSFGFVKKKTKEENDKLYETLKKTFKGSEFKQLEFKDKGVESNALVRKLRAM